MSNIGKLDNLLERQVIALLQQRLPSGWKTMLARSGNLLNLTGPQRDRLKIVIEIKTNLEPKDVTILAEQLQNKAKTDKPFLWLSPPISV